MSYSIFLLSQVPAVPALWEKPPSGSSGCLPSCHLGRPTKSILQVPLQKAPPDTSDSKPHKGPGDEPSQQPGNKKKFRTSSRKAEPVCMGHFHNRHIFQQQLIEKQKKKLQEQQKTILELKENQRLAEVRWAAGRTHPQSCQLSDPGEDEWERTCQVLPKYVHCIGTFSGVFVVVAIVLLCGQKAPEFYPTSRLHNCLLCTCKAERTHTL